MLKKIKNSTNKTPMLQISLDKLIVNEKVYNNYARLINQLIIIFKYLFQEL